jgi:hypothetical protein
MNDCHRMQTQTHQRNMNGTPDISVEGVADHFPQRLQPAIGVLFVPPEKPEIRLDANDRPCVRNQTCIRSLNLKATLSTRRERGRLGRDEDALARDSPGPAFSLEDLHGSRRGAPGYAV